MAQATLAPEIRGVLIPVTDARALLPNACVSEVITYGTPQVVDEAPDWVLGIVTWRGWRMPLFSFSKLCGRAEEESTSGAKVAILKAFGGIHKMPYMALLAQGFPRLTTVTAEKLVLEGDQETLPEGVLYRVTIEDEEALIPNLNAIEQELLKLIGPGQRRGMDGEDQGAWNEPSTTSDEDAASTDQSTPAGEDSSDDGAMEAGARDEAVGEAGEIDIDDIDFGLEDDAAPEDTDEPDDAKD